MSFCRLVDTYEFCVQGTQEDSDVPGEVVMLKESFNLHDVKERLMLSLELFNLMEDATELRERFKNSEATVLASVLQLLSHNNEERAELLTHLSASHRTGGRVFRRRPQLILLNHLCCLTSLAPVRLPSRTASSLISKEVITSLHFLCTPQRQRSSEPALSVGTYDEIRG